MYGKYPYVTLDNIKNYLNITSNNEDARLSNLIYYACSATENYIGHEILSNSYSDVFDGGKASIFVNKLPLQNVYSIVEYDGNAYRKLNNPQSDGSSVNRSSPNHSIESINNAILKSRYKKFGDSSGFFDGTNYLTVPTSDDWYFGNSDFTIELQIRANSYNFNSTFISQVEDANNYWSFGYSNTNGITFRAISAGIETINVSHATTTGYTANSFHHIELSRRSTTFNLFRDGTIIKTLSSVANVMPDLEASIEFGRQNISSNYQYYNGFIDESRITHVAQHTANFSAPSYQYSTDDNTVLLIHFDGDNNTASFKDDHATTEDFLFYQDTGEITKNIGSGAGNFDLSLIGASTFRNYPRGVRVFYKAGYDSNDVPNDIIMATMDYIKMLHKDRQESQSFSLQGENVQDRQLSANFPPHIRRILDLYRII
jgi:hypothetical protein